MNKETLRFLYKEYDKSYEEQVTKGVKEPI